MRALVLAVLAGLTLGLVACSNPPPAESVVCTSDPVGCTCDLQSSSTAPGQVSSCNPSVFPQTQCCAATGWPSSGTCDCTTSSIFCGVVPGYVMATSGVPGEDACVCSNDPYSEQIIGPTCYANGATAAGAGLGTCCFFSADAPGSLGSAACVCAAGLHTCGTGGTMIDSCSAASFPATPATCGGGTTQVTACL
jgi:hypothetical protein